MKSFQRVTSFFNFNAAGFDVLEKHNDTKNYCFDDLGVEPTGCHYTKECNVMGEILLSRYDVFKKSMELVLSGAEARPTSPPTSTHMNLKLVMVTG